MKLDKLKKRVHYYKSALGSYRQYSGTIEAVRAFTRFALRVPSDRLRQLRWNLVSKNVTDLDKVILSFDKFKLCVDAHDEGIAAELAIDKMHEPFGTKILQSILRDDMTVIDIGANIGYYVMSEATACSLKKIVAIEPNPLSFDNLMANVTLNRINNVDAHNMAVSNQDGKLPFYISSRSNVCRLDPRDDYQEIIDVPVVRLDSFVESQHIDKVDMIRMDIEGHEVKALQGMIRTLERDKPWLCLEYHSTLISDNERDEFIQTLETLGYTLKAFTFRWSEYPIFGHNIVDRENIIKHGDLRTVLLDIPCQILLLFLAPESTEYHDIEL